MVDSNEVINKFKATPIDKHLVQPNIEDKINRIEEQLDLVLKSNARLRVDLKEIVQQAVKSAVSKHSTKGYSQITA